MQPVPRAAPQLQPQPQPQPQQQHGSPRDPRTLSKQDKQRLHMQQQGQHAPRDSRPQ
jgi:hypothetical protein